MFRNGVNSYLKRHAYANASAEDFWNEIAAISDKPVDRIMASYVDQKGSPLISVRAECAGSRTTVTLSQQRFFDRDTASEARAHWQVPVCFKRPDANASTQQQCQLFTAARSLRQSLENIDTCIALKSRADAALTEFLTGRQAMGGGR